LNFIYWVKSAVDMSPIIINYFLRLLIVYVISKTRQETVSKQTMVIMKYVFILQFLNTGPLFLIVNMDLSEYTSIMPFNGLHPDFTISWYKDVGKTIVSTMIFNMFWPIIEFFINYLIRLAFRMKDTMFFIRET